MQNNNQVPPTGNTKQQLIPGKLYQIVAADSVSVKTTNGEKVITWIMLGGRGSKIHFPLIYVRDHLFMTLDLKVIKVKNKHKRPASLKHILRSVERTEIREHSVLSAQQWFDRRLDMWFGDL